MKKVIALATASAIAVTATQPAKSQVLEGLSLASTLISMGGRGSDPSLTAIMAQMRMLEAMGQRLTGIEGSLTLILQKLDAMPEEMRKALTEDADRDRIEKTVSAISILKGYVGGLPEARKIGKKQYEDRLQTTRAVLVEFQFRRGDLFQRSDMVVPEIVASLVSEVTALDATGLSSDVSRTLSEYYTRLEAVNSPGRPKSLFNIKSALEAKLQKQQAEIAKLIVGKPNVAMIEAPYPWYAHTKFHPERRVRTEVHPTAVMGPGDIGQMETSWVPYTENVPEHTRVLSLQLIKLPIDDENSAGLFHFEVKVTTDQTEGGNPGREGHASTDDEYEKTAHQDVKKILDAEVSDYNATIDAVVSIRKLESIAAAGRALILKWNFSDAKQLASTIKTDDLSAQALLNDLDRRKREEQTQGAADAMTAARENAERVTAESFKRVENAVEEAHKNQWRSDFANFVTVLKLSYNFYTVTKPYLQSAANEKPNANDKPSAGATPSKTGTSKDAAATKKDNKPNAAAVEQSSGSAFSLAQRPKELERGLQEALADVAKHPASGWKTLPKQLVKEEITLMEIEQTLRALPQTEADKMATTSQGQVNQAAEDGSKGFASGGPVGAVKAILKDTLKPVYLGDDGPLGAESRQALEVQTNKLMQEFFDARFGKPTENLTPSRDFSNQCTDPHGCYSPNNKPLP